MLLQVRHETGLLVTVVRHFPVLQGGYLLKEMFPPSLSAGVQVKGRVLLAVHRACASSSVKLISREQADTTKAC